MKMSDYRLMRRMSALSRRRVFTSIKWAPPSRLDIPTFLGDPYGATRSQSCMTAVSLLQAAAMQREESFASVSFLVSQLSELGYPPNGLALKYRQF